MGFKQKTIQPLNAGDKRLILKIILESKNLQGIDFEKTVTVVKKLQEQIIESEEKR